MAGAAEVARAHYRAQAIQTRETTALLQGLWASVSVADLDGSWAAIAERATQVLALGQYRAARSSSGYVAAQAAAQGLDDATDGVVDPRAFTGVAADGRDLGTLLEGSIVQVKTSIAAGLPESDAMLRGLSRLLLIGANEVEQAGRNADHVAMTSTPTITGYVRMLQPPSCGRCVILAGKWFRWNQGFARHPKCDCIHVPAAEAAGVDDVRTDPKGYFDSLDPAGQAKVAGSEANARAVRDGGDLGQVVNIYNRRTRRTLVGGSSYAPNSGLHTFDFGGRTVQYTNEGANVLRGRYGRAAGAATGQTDQLQRRLRGLYPKASQFELADVRRLTPRSIYELAGDDRALAVELLHRYGYIT